MFVSFKPQKEPILHDILIGIIGKILAGANNNFFQPDWLLVHKTIFSWSLGLDVSFTPFELSVSPIKYIEDLSRFEKNFFQEDDEAHFL